MSMRFIASGLVTTVTNLLLHAAVYFAILKDFYRSHPAGTEEFIKLLHRAPGEMIGWAMAITSLAMGFLITIAIKWSGATTFSAGLKRGFIFAFLFWASVNFGLYATSNYFSLASVIVDYVCSVAIMTISGAVAARMLGGRTTP